MEKRHGLISKGISSDWRAYRSEEFGEADVWDVIKDESENGFRNGGGRGVTVTSRLSVSRRLPSAARMIPLTQNHQPNNDAVHKLMHHSAPLNIPDWSKIYGKTLGTKNCASPDGSGESGEDDEEEEEDDDDGRLPPHEWLARKLARTQISSFSVCEGAGRTLKGRDLRRVRDAVLSKTGFL